MKNATPLHERIVAGFLRSAGCTKLRLENGSLVALRPGRDGRLYPLSVDVYEDDSIPAGSPLRFRARAARRFGLPVAYAHGPSVESALAAIEWIALDRPPIPQPQPALTGALWARPDGPPGLSQAAR